MTKPLLDRDERDGAEEQEGHGCVGAGGPADQHSDAVPANAAATTGGETHARDPSVLLPGKLDDAMIAPNALEAL